jgi:hypothetical protein
VGDELEGVTSEPAGPQAVAAQFPALTRGLRLFVAHDAASLEDLFKQIEGSGERLVCRIVSQAERPIGWYVYVSGPDRNARVLHIGAARDRSDAVVGDLVREAGAAGMKVISGRSEPHLLGPLRRRLAIFGVARQPVIHAADPALTALAMSPAAQISRLDGEWFVI